jgi:predicted TPR repeat methyltransferase
LESLGSSLYQLGRRDQAAGVYRRWLEVDSGNAVAQHLYAATSRDKVPQRASAQYVTSVFDRFADSFDSTLQRLDYAAPRLLHEALLQRLDCGRGALVVLDAGCGTGLCGVLLRSIAKFLAGVDLSSQMLAKARALNLYDELFEAEICAFMASRPGEFDLVICADTLIYFGALEEPLMAARRCLRPGGVFAFTVEALPAETSTPFTINAHGRYAHAGDYLRATLESSGFSAVQCRPVVLRKEFGNDVQGHLVIGSAPT